MNVMFTVAEGGVSLVILVLLLIFQLQFALDVVNKSTCMRSVMSHIAHRASGTRPTMMWESSTLLSAYGCAWMRWDISENYLFRFRFDGLCSPISPLAAWIVERRTLHEEFKLSAVYSTHTLQCISLLVGIEWVWVGNVFHLILIRANLYL